MSVRDTRKMNCAVRRGFGSGKRRSRPGIEGLEGRELLATVTVNASQVVRTVNTQLLGVNVAWYDSDLNTSQTQQMVQAAGLTMFRFPGGSSSDDFHFNAPPTYNGEGTDGSMASFIASVNGVGMATIDYGSGSPQEAAAFLAYLEAPVGNTTPIGSGQEWNDSTNAWQTVNWQTAGYWASLRAAAPLAQDDGLNFLRLDHPAPFNVQYWEVGNEEYGSWEIDHHTAQHDPATYIAFAKQFATYAAQIDPTISIGLDVGSPGSDFNNWTAAILQQSVAQGFMPGFLSDHNYVQAPGSENDSNLLLDTTTGTSSDPSDPGDPYNWAARAAGYESLLTQYLGASGKNVQLLATEFNSVYSNPGKQTTSLVNGLWLADSLGALLETPYNGADVWDLRNSYESGGNDSSSLYGWRQDGDYGLIGSPDGSPPASGPYVPYPTYFAEELAAKIIQAGGNVVQAASSDPNLTAYAVVEPNGHLDLLVVNKSATSALSGQFQLDNFQPAAQATVWQYGEAQDTAQSQSSTGASALANFTAALTVSGSTFSYSFPAYSMTVLDLGKASSGTSGPTITKAAAATPSPVTGKTTALSVSASDPAGASSLTYTWIAIAAAPAPVTFSANGTNAAQNVTATFAAAGSYNFQVTVSDPSGYIVTSSVTVVVNQTLTSIIVSPGSITLAAGAGEQFKGVGYDQFGNPLSAQPALSWSVKSGVGSIVASSGLYTAPSAAGTATVQASSGGVLGTASVTVLPPSNGSISATASFSIVSAWNTGFEANVTLTNTGSAPITNWILQFNFAATITQIWNATVQSHSGSQYVIDNAGYNSTIAPGQSVSFGFLGSPGGIPASPTNYVLNGAPVNSSSPPSGPLAATVSFADVNDWGSGFTGNITITNTGTTPIEGWTLSFDFAVSISSIWNATLVSQIGAQYVISDAGYNAIIQPGQSVTIGFNASPGHPSAGPTNYVLNGVKIG
ncbi:MAG: cellulose binding domain-containing protein [Isosphaeraceae bacterium]